MSFYKMLRIYYLMLEVRYTNIVLRLNIFIEYLFNSTQIGVVFYRKYMTPNRFNQRFLMKNNTNGCGRCCDVVGIFRITLLYSS